MGISSKAPAPPIIRLGHPMAFAAFLKRIGTPVERYFRSRGLPVYCDSPDEFVPLRQAWSFFDATAHSEDPMLGWHVGGFVGDQNLNRGLKLKLESSPTLYQALKRFVQLISAEASHLELGILERRKEILFFTQYSNMKGVAGYTSSQSYQLEIFADLVRHYVGPAWVPTTIGIEDSTVPAIAEEHFPGSRILTDQWAGYIAIPRACLHIGTRGSELEDRDGAPLVLAGEFDYADTLRSLLKPHLPEGYPSARLGASLMATSERTLARRLSARGVSYQVLVDKLRFETARDLLQDQSLRISEVSRAVGFGDSSHFSRMFRRIAGLSPRQFRKVAQA